MEKPSTLFVVKTLQNSQVLTSNLFLDLVTPIPTLAVDAVDSVCVDNVYPPIIAQILPLAKKDFCLQEKFVATLLLLLVIRNRTNAKLLRAIQISSQPLQELVS